MRIVGRLEAPELPAELARQGIAELKQLRPPWEGDFYPLLPLTTSQSDWYAFQLDRPDLGEGRAGRESAKQTTSIDSKPGSALLRHKRGVR